MKKDEEKDEVHNTFCDSIFVNKTNCSQGTQPSLLEDRIRSYKKALIIQGKMVSNLLHHLNTHKHIRLDRIHPRLLSWLSREISVDWRLINVVIPISK